MRLRDILIANLICFLLSKLILFTYLKYGLSLKGFYTEKVIVWLWLLTGLILLFNWRRIHKLFEAYFIIVIILIIASILLLSIPFFNFVYFTFKDNAHVYISERLRANGFVPPQLQIVEEGWLTEKVIVDVKITFEEIKSIALVKKEADLIHLKLRISEPSYLFSYIEYDTILVDAIKR